MHPVWMEALVGWSTGILVGSLIFLNNVVRPQLSCIVRTRLIIRNLSTRRSTKSKNREVCQCTPGAVTCCTCKILKKCMKNARIFCVCMGGGVSFVISYMYNTDWKNIWKIHNTLNWNEMNQDITNPWQKFTINTIMIKSWKNQIYTFIDHRDKSTWTYWTSIMAQNGQILIKSKVLW